MVKEYEKGTTFVVFDGSLYRKRITNSRIQEHGLTDFTTLRIYSIKYTSWTLVKGVYCILFVSFDSVE